MMIVAAVLVAMEAVPQRAAIGAVAMAVRQRAIALGLSLHDLLDLLDL
jgi:hypothetical protein